MAHVGEEMQRPLILAFAIVVALGACSKPTTAANGGQEASPATPSGATPGADTGDIQSNSNGLPAYPHLNKALMLPHDAYKGSLYAAYKQDTSDSLETVEDYYRKAWPGAQEGPTDNPNGYVGIKLTKGQDFIAIYRFGLMKTVSIDAMKYLGPAPAE